MRVPSSQCRSSMHAGLKPTVGLFVGHLDVQDRVVVLRWYECVYERRPFLLFVDAIQNEK